MTPDLSVSRDIAASPEAVFSAITDVTRMGEWSPECVKAEWNEPFSEPSVGAMFTGLNVHGDKEWTIESKIVELIDNERFFFDCISGITPGYVFASWGYIIEATSSGCRVTECWQDYRPDFMKERSALATGITDRPAHNRAGMEATLGRLAAAVE